MPWCSLVGQDGALPLLQSFTRHCLTARQLIQTGSGFAASIPFQRSLNLFIFFKSSITSEQ